MRVINTKLLALAIICSLYSLFVGCTGNNLTAGRDARPPEAIADAGRLSALPESPLEPSTFTLNPSPSSLPVPKGVEAQVWQQLTTELERQLISVRGASRVDDGLLIRSASTPPTRPLSQTMLSATETELRWGYYSNGDYDQNGEVNVADLTPLAIHFQETAWPFKFVESTIQAVVDGDGNGEINLADVTPIALNFQNNVSKYNIYRSQNPAEYPTEPDAGNGSASLIGSMLLSNATGTPNALRLQFASLRPDALRDDYFWVRPVDNEDTEGIASNRLGPLSDTFVLDGHVYMAGGGIDPLPDVPVELTENGEVVATDVTDFNGYYSFELPFGDYTVTPTGDPFGYSPEFIEATITNEDIYLAPIYPAPVDIFHRWALDGGSGFAHPAGAMAMDAEGNVFISDQGFLWSNQYFLLKYDLFGKLLWSQVFDLPYGVGNSDIFLLPGGEIYLYGQYDTIEADELNESDLFVMKLDSSGNLIWDFGYNFPPLDLSDFNDYGSSGYVDAQDNLILFANSMDADTEWAEVGESFDYQLTISPDGELLGQAQLYLTAPEHPGVDLSFFGFDQSGGLIASGQMKGDAPSTQALLVKFNSTGEIDWINNFGDVMVDDMGLSVGLDGSFYSLFKGNQPGVPGEQEIQLAHYNNNGVRIWENLYISGLSHGRGFLAVGPQGKLWLAGFESDLEAAEQLSFPFIWSFQPDGSLRFSRQWVGGLDGQGNRQALPFGLEVNRYGVTVSAGVASSSSGIWGEHAITIEEVDWEITHGGSFTITPDSTMAALRELPATAIPDVGTVDPPPDDGFLKTYIMLYRP